MNKDPLPTDFYDRPTLDVTRELLGCRLVRILDGVRLSGIITETEAYVGETDLASHARVGKTLRTAPMYGLPGRAYVYFIYGAHWCLNVVTEAEGTPSAVLIRAIEVEEGLGVVESRRAPRTKRGARAKRADWTNGPAKLTVAFAIDGSLNNVDMTTTESGLWIEPGIKIPDSSVTIGPRVGLYNVPDPWKSIPWRFIAKTPRENPSSLS
jgi:DNA-3-methyladenine glycosylase